MKLSHLSINGPLLAVACCLILSSGCSSGAGNQDSTGSAGSATNQSTGSSATGSTGTTTSGATDGTASGATSGSNSSSSTTGHASAGTTGDVKPAVSKDGSSSANPESNRIYPLSNLRVVNLGVNGKTIRAWVMDDNPKREEGLMYVTNKDIADDQGMIFVFGTPQALTFWMHNTLIPLDIVYITASGKVANVVNAKAMDDTNLPSKGLCNRVLELKAGGAVKFGITAGTMISIPKDVVSQDGN